MNFSNAVLRALLIAAFSATAASAKPKEIKFATLAPEGSTWLKVMRELDAELQKKTGGSLKFKIYAGGVSGDEKDVVKKIRIGQLHAAGFTGVGLGDIAPRVRILDAPWLFQNSREVDHIHGVFDEEFSAAIEEGGYILLGWTDLGFVHIFSKTPISVPEDMRLAKMWMWEGDPIARAAYRAVGVSPIPLSIVDVMSSLETGLIDAVYGPPMGVVALQWFSRTKYIYPLPLANSAGAVLISKKFFDGLAPSQAKALKEVSARHLRRLTELIRAENQEALKALQKQGLALSPQPSPDTVKLYAALGRKARRDLAGTLYPVEWLKKAEKSLEAFRQTDHGKPKKR